MAHNLYIRVEDSVNDNKFMHVTDVSHYDDVLPVTRRILQILPPFTDEYIEMPFPYLGGFSLTTRDFKLSTAEAFDLPDGLYKLHYSIAPNSKVSITVNHFRISVLMNKVLSKMMLVSTECKTVTDECGNIEINKYQNMLIHIWMLLKAVQCSATDDLGGEKAKDLYRQAWSAYDKLYNNNDNCKIC